MIVESGFGVSACSAPAMREILAGGVRVVLRAAVVHILGMELCDGQNV
jgi:hypothetical protein